MTESCECRVETDEEHEIYDCYWQFARKVNYCSRHAESTVARLEARVRVLEEGLKKYAWHTNDECGSCVPDCNCYGNLMIHQGRSPCECGLSTLLTTGGGT